MCRKKAVAKKNRNDIFILIRTRRHATRRDADDDERTKDAMYIEEVCIDGFKSYAKRTVVPGFDPLFNAITGLNGSGKSNILDSICFVLGISNLTHVRTRSSERDDDDDVFLVLFVPGVSQRVGVRSLNHFIPRVCWF
jgi:hypothetical protein